MIRGVMYNTCISMFIFLSINITKNVVAMNLQNNQINNGTSNGKLEPARLENKTQLIDRTDTITNSFNPERNCSQNNTVNLETHNSYETIIKFMQCAERERPDLVRTSVIGYSSMGRPIVIIKIGKQNVEKPAIFMECGIHAREWSAPATAMHHIYQLVYNQSGSDLLTKLSEKIDFIFLPVANPDGYEYSRNEMRSWRKSRGVGGKPCTDREYSCGVDLNRNFDIHWNRGTDIRRSSKNYRGSSPLSEPETRAIADYVSEHNNTIVAYFALHSSGKVWGVPYVFEDYPVLLADNHAEIIRLAQKGINATLSFDKIGDEPYRVGNFIGDLDLGGDPTGGTSVDYMKAILNITYALTIEMPKDPVGSRFFQNPADIIPQSEQLFEAVMVMASDIANVDY